MGEKCGEMLFVKGVVENAGKSMKREVHSKFKGMKVVGVEVVAEVSEVVVEETKLFSWGCLPGEEGGGEGGRYRGGGEIGAFTGRMIDVVALGSETNGSNKGNDI